MLILFSVLQYIVHLHTIITQLHCLPLQYILHTSQCDVDSSPILVLVICDEINIKLSSGSSFIPFALQYAASNLKKSWGMRLLKGLINFRPRPPFFVSKIVYCKLPGHIALELLECGRAKLHVHANRKDRKFFDILNRLVPRLL